MQLVFGQSNSDRDFRGTRSRLVTIVRIWQNPAHYKFQRSSFIHKDVVMRRLLAILFGVLLGGGIVYAAFEYHVVRTKERFLLVRKQKSAWRDAYADVRAWTPREWTDHKELTRNLIADGYGEYVPRSPTENFFHDLFGGFRDNSLFNHGSSRRAIRE